MSPDRLTGSRRRDLLVEGGPDAGTLHPGASNETERMSDTATEAPEFAAKLVLMFSSVAARSPSLISVQSYGTVIHTATIGAWVGLVVGCGVKPRQVTATS